MVRSLLPAFVLLLLVSCGQEPGPVRSTSNFRMMDDTLLNYNKGVVRTEDQEIRDFAARYGWDMISTPTGVRYLIYKQGTGAKAEKGKVAMICYQTGLLNGRPLYSSDSLGAREITVGFGDTEPGIQEAIQLLREGDRAKVIIPSRLAFGLIGDGKRIPPGATLVYDIELVEVKSAQTSKPKPKKP